MVAVKSPSVSVLIPTYNYAGFLAEAVESVLMQDFPDFELLIVDDCSADHTAEVVKPFCSHDARVRFSVNSVNLGMVNNWNHCLRQARGEYIKFLFGDDKLSDPQALGKMIALLRKNPSAVLAASARTILDEKSSVTDIWSPLRDGCHDGREIIESCLIEYGNLIGEPSSVLFRKNAAQRGFDAKLAQIVDVEMWFHLLENGNLAYTREPLCAFRQHAEQRSAFNNMTGRAWKEHALFFADYAAGPWLSRKARFACLFGLRRSLKKHPGAGDAETFERDQRLSNRLGKGWYLFYWFCYILGRPFENLDHSIRKRISRWLAGSSSRSKTSCAHCSAAMVQAAQDSSARPARLPGELDVISQPRPHQPADSQIINRLL
jgi:glycosyltransferase involved in cell wall biosynthesis